MPEEESKEEIDSPQKRPVLVEEQNSVISTSRQTQAGFEFRMSRPEEAE